MTSVPSSISSSEVLGKVRADDVSSAYRRAPKIRWQILLSGLTLFALFVAAMEARLAIRGIRPTAVDNDAAWIRERARASSLGERAVILIGASRMQTDIDLDVLRARTKLEPVQLAIDASSFIPVLAGLAQDPAIRGTVIVSFMDSALATPEDKNSVANRYQDMYADHLRVGRRFDYLTVENTLTEIVRYRLRSYADGTRPLTSLLTRIIPTTVIPQHAIVLPDRSRLADYANLDVPAVYYQGTVFFANWGKA